jgi:alpha-amylase
MGMGSSSFTVTSEQTGLSPTLEYPAVPYGPSDFHCERTLSSWNDPLALNAGWLSGLTDLNTEKEEVQQRIADYFTDLIGIGFSAFRIDAAKHIKPDDLVGILSKFQANMGGKLPADWFTWLEVLLGGEHDMLMCNKDSGYNFGEYLTEKLEAAGITGGDLEKVKIWFTGYPSETSADCGKVSQTRELVQNDDHDQQNPGSSSRDMHDQGSVLVKTHDIDAHRGFEVKLFQNPNGAVDNSNSWPLRAVLSSYWFLDDGTMAPPDGFSDCATGCAGDSCKAGCKGRPKISAYSAASTGYDDDGGYTRVHRDAAIVAAMRSWMGLGAWEFNATTVY